MTTETNLSLPDLYARVQKVCLEACPPQVAVVDGRFQLAVECSDVGHCASWSWATDSTMPVIESLILTSCVRWLADNGIETRVYPREGSDPYVVHVDEYGEDGSAGFYKNDNLTIATLLAVEAVCKERSHD